MTGLFYDAAAKVTNKRAQLAYNDPALEALISSAQLALES